jgi:hypothetical protein
MYQVRIKYQDSESQNDYFTTKREVIRWIATETCSTQRAIANEIAAKDDSEIYRDSQGWRAQVWYS